MGLIEVKTFTSAAEMQAAHAATRARLMGRPALPRRVEIKIPTISEPKPKRYLIWSSMTTQQRCDAIRNNWREGITARQVADAIGKQIGEDVTRTAILATANRHRDGRLSGISFTSSGGGNGRPRARDEKVQVTADPSKLGRVKEILSEDLVDITDLIEAVCDWQRVPVKDVMGPSKFSIHVLPRQKLMWLLLKNTDLSSYRVGLEIGERDHSCALNAAKKIDKMIRNSDPKVADLAGFSSMTDMEDKE